MPEETPANSAPEHGTEISRRQMLATAARTAAAVGGAAGVIALASKAGGAENRWQIDPQACIACERCATECVLQDSAVKAVHAFAICGYCKLCSGFFEPGAAALNSGAENQMCPVGAIKRRYVEDPYYQYEIDEKLCIGCSRCVKGCTSYGNGSLFMQVRHDRCLNCNQCRIALKCPAQAFRRVPAKQPYLLKKREHSE